MTDQPTPSTFHSAAAATPALQPRFALWGSRAPLSAFGHEHDLERGPIATLAQRSRAFFAARPGGPRILVGAVPFDRKAPDYLFQPSFVLHTGELPDTGSRLASTQGRLTAEPNPAQYAAAVEKALALMQADKNLRKVVLSRSLLLETSGDINPFALAAQLAEDDSVTTFMAALPRGDADVARTLVGATPELLIRKNGTAIASHPLAGSTPRSTDANADQAAAAALERSEKDLREHAAVVEAILDTLNPLCRDLIVPEGPSRRATATMWHLGTPIQGTLKHADTDIAELVAALHPTPAVCGLPRDPAQTVIQDLESYDRQFYAGAVGWIDQAGDGAWYVSIRCAEIAGTQARLYAGAGIVPGSDPQAEARETSAKFLALLRALGVDESGRPVMGNAS